MRVQDIFMYITDSAEFESRSLTIYFIIIFLSGSCLFWEFASEGFDIGFGVFFEWSADSNTNVRVSLDNSEDEFDENVDADSDKTKHKAKVDEVLPVLRRNSHEEVIVGSHLYPGQGVYLLKFDNSYSLLRSKTLYYRVYYTK